MIVVSNEASWVVVVVTGVVPCTVTNMGVTSEAVTTETIVVEAVAAKTVTAEIVVVGIAGNPTISPVVPTMVMTIVRTPSNANSCFRGVPHDRNSSDRCDTK